MASDTEIRDQLALDRTHLANERTLLAYIRTALALAGAGAGLIQFFDTSTSQPTGWTLIALGVLGLFVGVWRFLTVRRHLSAKPRSAEKPA